MITRYPAISDKIGPWMQSEDSMYGQKSENLYEIMSVLAQLAVVTNHADIVLSGYSNPYRFRFGRGTQSLWILLKNYQIPTATMPF